MNAILSLLSMGFGCFGVLPLILAVVALVDAVRVGADWYWYMIILAFPVLGSIAYFVVVRSPMLGARNAGMMSPVAARRLQARRRLRQLQVQLANWRGPGILAEAGEELMVLGKTQEAEKLLRESKENGGAVEDVNYGLAQCLEMQGRWAEAIPLLQDLVKVEPDSHLGEGPLHLARSLDEAGRGEEAEPVLRKLLERRTVIEAQVRLARILLRKGEREEAGRLTSEVLTDSRILPRYLKRQHRAWIRAAGRLKTGTERLPRSRFEGDRPPILRTALIVAGALAVAVLIAGYAWMNYFEQHESSSMEEIHQQQQEALGQMEALDRSHPWTHGDDLGKMDLTATDLDRYLRVRRGLEPALKKFAAGRLRYYEAMNNPRSVGIFALPESVRRWQRTQATFQKDFVHELQREEMGPGEFEKLTTLIDWRFLRRPAAMIFALPDYSRADWLGTRAALANSPEFQGDPAGRRRWEQLRRRNEAKVKDLERTAAEATELSPATRQLLESRRAELEGLDPGDAEPLIHVLDLSVGWS